MRELTKNEKAVIRTLIICPEFGSMTDRLGDVLRQQYAIECIEPPKEHQDPNIVNIVFDSCKVNPGTIFEAINLFDLLIRERYIVAIPRYSTTIIGNKHELMYPKTKNSYIIETEIPCYYDYKLWDLLSSHYYVTNALRDFAKDFKTVEQRRYEKELSVAFNSACWSRAAAIIAGITLLISIGFDIYQLNVPQGIEPSQINLIENAIKANQIKEPLNVEIADTIVTKPLEINVQLTSPQKNTTLKK